MKYFTRTYWTTPRADTLGLTPRAEVLLALAVASPIMFLTTVIGAIIVLAIKFHGG